MRETCPFSRALVTALIPMQIPKAVVVDSVVGVFGVGSTDGVDVVAPSSEIFLFLVFFSSKASLQKRKREEGRGKREEGRGKREEGRGKREEGRGREMSKKITPPVMVIISTNLLSFLFFPAVAFS